MSEEKLTFNEKFNGFKNKLTNDTKYRDKFTRILIWTLISFTTVLTAVFFIIQVLRIYYGENDGQVYTPEIVGKRLLEILALIIIWLVLVVFGGIMSFIKKLDCDTKITNTNEMKLNSILAILPFDKMENDESYEALNKEKKKRMICWLIFFVVLGVCLLFSLLYLSNKENYAANGNPTKQSVSIILHILPFVLVGFLSFGVATVYEHYSYNRSLILAKELLAKYKKGSLNIKEETKRNKIIYHSFQAILVCLALVFIIVGALNGGVTSVLNKAIAICSECIGLG